MPTVLRPKSKKSASERSLVRRVRFANRTIEWENKAGPVFALLIVSALVMVALLKQFGLPEKYAFGSSAVLSALLFAILFGYVGVSAYKSQNWAEEVRTLCETANVQDTGVLLETLEVIHRMASSVIEEKRNTEGRTDYTVVEEKVYSVLLRLLPRIEANDWHVLNENSHRILRDILTRALPYGESLDRYDRERSRMHYAIVETLAKVGDSRDLPALQKVASGQVSDMASGVRAAAKEAIQSIQARRGNEVIRQELLRPAQSPVRSGQELLRPAVSVPDGQEEELLRAVENRQNS